MTIWDEYGISLEEYAKSFNEAIDAAYQEYMKDKCYLVNQVGGKTNVRRIVNIRF